MLGGCSKKLGEVQAPIEEPAAFSASGTAVLPDRWWTAFDDPVLNELVETALDSNLRLQANWQQFQAALAVVDRESSFLWPQAEVYAGASIDRPEQDFSSGEDLQIGVGASYEIDLWGRIRAGVQAEKFRAQATFLDHQAAAMTLSAETAITWYRLVTTAKQLELAEEQIEINQNIMKLIRNRFASGQVRAVDILRQEQLLESTRDQKIFYERQLQILENDLSVLLGKPPQNELDLPEKSLPKLPLLPDTGLPLELIRRRPDVRQAYNLVLAADRELAQAIRAKYPRLSLDVSGEFVSQSYNDLFRNWAYTLAGNLVAPVFYGGRLRAEAERTEAVKEQRLYEYGQTVLTSFREVENALIREIAQKQSIEVTERRLELAQKTNGQLRIEFLNGMSDYLDVLLGLDEEQQLQRDLLDAKQELLEIRIALYRSLAGGLEMPEIP
ncbi:efflux transporter, outer membrane factor (OMF) lipoprotein, NodT family [Salinimicrobium catena]|uniref:Efflux transporter, outer membrane factor (OMF) lipoprotein, NodT family n=1 Tax=Salinimicrobium catena TaxID=390640 RepID=A0A1H5NP13_9FLAO|nr:TolC family protein [Salinimicrobium catena]SDL56042.1 efflux transporter, outer membrane factor (OMF) lipoprotein, NodT family [Salinimicrobium catena]SEF03293.1 efflux transporter, outer membrane factor (OMF) lipoprotein, NodT family [Salinimicrobium catena]